MKTALYLVMAGAFVVAAGLLAPGCKEQSSQAPAGTSQTGDASEAAAAIAQKLCPVTDDPIDPKIYVDYQGRRVYFCCEMCPPMFKKDPEKYLKKLDEQMKGAAPAAKDTPPAAEKPILHWTCAMHPEVKADKPGKCPKCGMTLVPVTESPKEPTGK
jgi:YHS domain-containing protein